MRIFYKRLAIRKSFVPSDSPGAPRDPCRGGGGGAGLSHPRLGIKEARHNAHKRKRKTKRPKILKVNPDIILAS